MCSHDVNPKAKLETATDSENSPYRLPGYIKPEHYQLELAANLETFSFLGQESIEISVEKPTTQILLNALDIDFQSVELLAAGKETGQKAKITLQPENERALLSFDQIINPGKYSLKISFTGIINDKLRGFYRSAQTTPQGEKRWIALTQFEATDARRAFPCFDEPSFKATFQLTLVIDEYLTAISNSPIAKESVKEGKKTVTFKPTMKMSTYIMAFVVGEFEKSDTVPVDGKPLTIWAPLGKGHLTSFALEIGASALNFFNSYYGIAYPCEKMDMIAVPDFAFGAMENLGAVIYRENALLVDRNTASHAELERVADVVAHELAHMWFGNLTTMKWWNGIWLNEAFATFMELVAVDNFSKSWKRWETFGVSRAMAFATDGLKATRAIEFPVNAPQECNGMFDVLTYEKGASVLRMLEQFIGEDKFKAGVNAYLNAHKYANTETEDLWQALGEASDKPITSIMNSWIYQPGHPVVSVSLKEPDNKTVVLEQNRFYYLAGEKSNELYEIPLLLRAYTASGVEEVAFHFKEQKAELSFKNPIERVVLNSGGHGFYRAAYDEKLLQKLTALTQNNGLAALERFNLVNDLFALLLNGSLTLDAFLEFLKHFKEETDKNVWTAIATCLSYLNRCLDQKRADIAKFTHDLAAPLFDKLGFIPQANESELTGQLRGIIINLLGTVGDDKEIQKEAKTLYSLWLEGKTQLAPDVLSSVVMILSHTGDEKRYEEFLAAFKAGKSPQEQERYMYALANFPVPALLERTLALTITGEIKGQNAPYVVRNLMLNPNGRHVGWNFVKTNWDQVGKLFPTMILTRLVEGVTGLTQESLAQEVFSFFSAHNVLGGEKTVAQHLEKLQVALALCRREG
jgi:puromycin-sensitive aminopeptidase